MSWLYIEPDLTLWQNLRLRFWLLGMDVLAPLYWRTPWPSVWSKETRGARAYLYCVERAGDLTYGDPPIGPAAPWPEDL